MGELLGLGVAWAMRCRHGSRRMQLEGLPAALRHVFCSL